MKPKPAGRRSAGIIQQPKKGRPHLPAGLGPERATMLRPAVGPVSGQNAPQFFRASSFKIVIRKVEPPFSGRPIDELDWICQSLGFFEPFEKENPASQVFREIIKATEGGSPVTSTGLAERISMSRGAVIHHLNSLMRSGLIVKNGRFYVSRSRSIFRTIEEIEEDIERIFARMKRTALEIDEELGVAQREKQ